MRYLVSRRKAILGLLAGSGAAKADVCAHFDPANPPGVEGFNCESRSVAGRTHNLYWKGTGPAVFVLHEIPGLYRADIDLARRIEKRRFTAYVPLFFGQPGDCHPTRNLFTKPLNPTSEFSFWLPRTPPAAHWLRAQLEFAHARSGGKGVALIGMCMTGSLPLAVISSPLVKAAVLCQPTNPFAFPWLPDLSAADRRALEQSTTEVLGFHFSQDWLSPQARWSRIGKILGSRLTEILIDNTFIKR